MFLPDSSSVALLLLVISMVCWGSWPNLLKASPGLRLEYFYLDYTFGWLVTMILIGATAGSEGVLGSEFVLRLLEAHRAEALFALAGGLVWNIGNILLLNAIMVAGLAVAFPISAVLGITLGVGISYLTQPIGSPVWLFAGALVLVAAAVLNAMAYRGHESAPAANKKLGITLSLAAGTLIGAFPPFVARALSGPHGLDPYTITIYFMIGASAASFAGLPLLLKKPFIGEAGSLGGYLRASGRWHWMGLLAGAIWCTGTFANFTSAGLVGVAVSWGIGSGAPMVGALWGIFLWREFSGASRRSQSLIGGSLALYTTGVVLVAIAYQLR